MPIRIEGCRTNTHAHNVQNGGVRAARPLGDVDPFGERAGCSTRDLSGQTHAVVRRSGDVAKEERAPVRRLPGLQTRRNRSALRRTQVRQLREDPTESPEIRRHVLRHNRDVLCPGSGATEIGDGETLRSTLRRCI